MNRPFKKYNGGKAQDGTYQKIISIITPHDIYIEPFLGNGSIFSHKLPARICSIGIDSDPIVIERWQQLDSKPEFLINANTLDSLPFINLLVRIVINLGGIPYIYFDPPYPLNVRRSQKQIYQTELTDDDHKKLLTFIRHLICNCSISSYPNKLYDEVLHDWYSFTFTNQTRIGPATEKIWFNYQVPSLLHDYRYVGNTFRGRERIKGLESRILSRFKRMPDLERNLLLSSINKLFTIN